MYVSSRISTSERWPTQLLEQGVGHAAVAGDEGIGVRQHDPLAVVEQRRAVDHVGMAAISSSLRPTVRHDLQCCENTNWLPRSHPARVWPSSRNAGSSWRSTAAVEHEPLHRMAQQIGRQREHGPPVARRPRGGAGFVDGIPVGPEQLVVHPQRQLVVGLVTVHLSQPRHWFDAVYSSTMPSDRPAGLHHVAYACRDIDATHRFYEDLMGFPLVHTELQEFPEGGYFRHVFYDLGDGSCLAFFDVHGVGERDGWTSAISDGNGLPIVGQPHRLRRRRGTPGRGPRAHDQRQVSTRNGARPRLVPLALLPRPERDHGRAVP